jgi:hypothetical protein
LQIIVDLCSHLAQLVPVLRRIVMVQKVRWECARTITCYNLLLSTMSYTALPDAKTHLRSIPDVTYSS